MEHELKHALQNALSIVDELSIKVKELSTRLAEVDIKEKAIAEREKATDAQLKELKARQARLIPTEQVMSTARENDRVRTELAQVQREIRSQQLAIQNTEAQSLERIRKAEDALGNLKIMKDEIIADRATLAEERRTMREKIMKEMSDKLARG
jgi:hypothetical protein